MKRLKELNLSPAYYKGIHDIAKDFYLPSMKLANRYDRAVAFFSSAVFIIAWPSLIEFVRGEGKIRLICSPYLNRNDVDAINEGYRGKEDKELGLILENQIKVMLENPVLSKPTRVIASLVSMGVMDIRIAQPIVSTNPFSNRLFHDKVGIFSDKYNDLIVFKGSMNETSAGLSLNGNIESVDVFLSWGDKRERMRVVDEEKYYNQLWNNKYPELIVRDFPESATMALLNSADNGQWENWTNEIAANLKNEHESYQFSWANGRKPYPHQRDALENWKNNNRTGILEHATGSGKTFTAILAIRDSINQNEIPLVLVPSIELMDQWLIEISQSTQDLDVHILKCGSGNTDWREKDLLQKWSRPGNQNKLIISTIQTASKETFQELIHDGEHIFIVADEVHRLGSQKFRNVFKIHTGARLGLSATPSRSGDPSGTKIVFDYFNGIVPPPFTLETAIKLGFLTPYFYHVHITELSEEEQSNWDNLSKKIATNYAKLKAMEYSDGEIFDKNKLLLIERARIVKSATSKPGLASKILQNEYSDGDKWIVYCDSQEQLRIVLYNLRKNNIRSNEYHSNMEGDRKETLHLFKTNGGVLVSIKCLDEGIDIPTVTHALILASSKNPREFIQRRGRVLRKAPGKNLSFVHDVLVIPNQGFQSKRTSDDAFPNSSIITNELARAIIFGRTAKNPSVINNIKKIAIKNDLNINELINEGFEDD